MNRVLRVREEIICYGVPESACVARVVEGPQEDVFIRFSTDEGKSVLSSMVGIMDRDLSKAKKQDNHMSPDGEAAAPEMVPGDPSAKKSKNVKKSAKKQSGEKPKPKGKAKAKAKGKANK